MNLEEILVRNLVTTSGRASLPPKPDFPISARNRKFSEQKSEILVLAEEMLDRLW